MVSVRSAGRHLPGRIIHVTFSTTTPSGKGAKCHNMTTIAYRLSVHVKDSRQMNGRSSRQVDSWSDPAGTSSQLVSFCCHHFQLRQAPKRPITDKHKIEWARLPSKVVPWENFKLFRPYQKSAVECAIKVHDRHAALWTINKLHFPSRRLRVSERLLLTPTTPPCNQKNEAGVTGKL